MNIITKKNDKTNVIAFDIEATCSHPEFEKYFRLRESNEKYLRKDGKLDLMQIYVSTSR